MLKQKKGIQLNQAVMAVATLVLIGILVIVAIVLFSNLDLATDTPNTLVSVVNETLTTVNFAGENFSVVDYRDVSCGAVSTVTNATSGTVINAGNYTQTGCFIKSITNGLYNNTNWNVSYTYTWSAPSSASNASVNTINQFATYPALVGLVGTIVFLGIVIGVLVSSFMFGGKEKA